MSKIKMKIGYVLMIIGISLPLLSLTKILYTDVTSNFQYRKFINEDRGESESYVENKIKKYNRELKYSKKTYMIDPFLNNEYNAEYDIYRKNPDRIFAYITIPKVKIKMPIRLGASHENLDKGAAHLDKTSLPVGGIGTRSVITGHRGWYKGNMFLHINKLKKGDKVYIERKGKKLEYTVVNSEIIMPNEWDKLKPEEGKDMLTLLTCDPVITRNPKRMLVNCEREENNYIGSFTDENLYAGADSGRTEEVKEVKYMDYLLKALVAAGWLMELILVRKIVSLKNKKYT